MARATCPETGYVEADCSDQIAKTACKRGGPYVYASALIFATGATLLLGSWWGLVSVPMLAVLLGIRIGIEEKALRTALPGYEDYAASVRYRLIPLIW